MENDSNVNNEEEIVDDYLVEFPEENLAVLEDNDSESDDDVRSNHQQDVNMIAASGRRWTNLSTEIRRRGRAPARNLLRSRPGVIPGVNPSSNKDSFFLFMDAIIDEAVRFTNLEARRRISEYNRAHQKQKVWTKIDREEMDAFIGLHVIGGALKANYRNTLSLWSERDGPPVFRATMSRERFLIIKRFFRFDDRTRRDATDPLSPVRDVWQAFVEKLQQFYVPHENLTIDEQLLEFHGRVKFRVYMKSKPSKYGIKIVWLCDAETSYALNAIPYIGETTLSLAEKNGMSTPEAITIAVVKPFLNKGYHITADNWFTSTSLAEKLMAKDTTLVGTVRSNKRELPPKARSIAGRQKKSAEFFSSRDQILVSYWDKGTKPVLLLSTLHTEAAINDVGLPEIIQHYNETKSGVDSMDRMVKYYTSKRKCFRWTYGFFCNMIDVALLNACVIMRPKAEPSTSDGNMFRFNFLMETGYELVDSQIKKRASVERLSKSVSIAMNLLGYKRRISNDATRIHQRSGRCKICAREKDRKTTQKCSSCDAFVCTMHSLKVIHCFDCSD